MLKFDIKLFSELSTTELYQLLKLRSEIFVVEQNCAYLDMDDKDFVCTHILGYYNDTLVAYTRLVPPTVSYTEPAIGRVITHFDYRKFGFGKQIMNFSIQAIKNLYPNKDIMIGAQSYLLKFYSELGFVKEDDDYLEDNIPHNHMRYKNT